MTMSEALTCPLCEMGIVSQCEIIGELNETQCLA